MHPFSDLPAPNFRRQTSAHDVNRLEVRRSLGGEAVFFQRLRMGVGDLFGADRDLAVAPCDLRSEIGGKYNHRNRYHRLLVLVDAECLGIDDRDDVVEGVVLLQRGAQALGFTDRVDGS